MIDEHASASSATSLTGSKSSRLVVLRGPSGTGKSSTARRLREHLDRSVALIEQDYLRRIVLKELDVPGGANIELISTAVRFARSRVACGLRRHHARGALP